MNRLLTAFAIAAVSVSSLAPRALAVDPDAVVHVSLKAPGYTSANAPEFARVKFNKAAPLCMISDDMSLGDYCSTWALFNGYPHSGTTQNRQYPRGDLLLDQAVRDLPAGYYDADLDGDGVADGIHAPLVFSDGAGGFRRFACSSAVFAYSDGNYLQITPEDVRTMMRTGWSCTFHDVNGADTSDAESIAARLGPISERWAARTGQPLKIMTEPNGNHVYLDACRISDEICWSIFQNSASGYPANPMTIDAWTDRVAGLPSSFESKPQGGFARIWAQGYESNFSNAVNAVISSGVGTKIIVGGTHGVSQEFKRFFQNEIQSSDLFWVASVDEIWEYYWLWHHASFENLAYDASTTTLSFDVRIPAPAKHRFREVTVNLPGLSGATDWSVSGAVTANGAQNAAGFTMNLGVEEHVYEDVEALLNLREQYVANPCIARDAQYLVGLLAPGPEKTAYQARLDTQWNYSWAIKTVTGETLFDGRCNSPTNIDYSVPLFFLHGTDLYRIDPDRYAGKWFPFCGGSFSLDDNNPSFATNWIYRLNEGYGIGWTNVVFYAEGEDLLPAARIDDRTTMGVSMQASALPEAGADVPATHLPAGRYKFCYKYIRPSGTAHSTWAVVTNGAVAWSASNSKNESSTTILSSEFELPRGTDVSIRVTPNSGSLCELVDCVWLKRTGDVATLGPNFTASASAGRNSATVTVAVADLGTDADHADITVTLGGVTQTRTITAAGEETFSFEGLELATPYAWSVTVDNGSDTATDDGTVTTRGVAVSLGPATAEVAADGASATLSVEVLSLDAPSATVTLRLDGEIVATRTVTQPGIVSETVAVTPGHQFSFTFTTEADGETAGANGAFTAYILDGWFHVRWGVDGYPEGANWNVAAAEAASGGAWTRPVGDASTLADGTLALDVPAPDGDTSANMLVFTPTNAATAGIDLVVEGVAQLVAGRLMPLAEAPLAGIALSTEGLRGWVGGAWTAFDSAPAVSGELNWRAEFDFSSDEAPRVRYTLAGTTLAVNGAEWLPVAAGVNHVSRVGFVGQGSLGDFRGILRKFASEPLPIPPPVFAPENPLGFTNGGATFSITLVDTESPFYYTAFVAESLEGPYLSETPSVHGTDGVLVLSIAAGDEHPARFARIVVSREPCTAAGVDLVDFMAQ